MNEEKLKRLSEATGHPLSELKKQYKELKEKYKDKPERVAWNMLMCKVRKRPEPQRRRAEIGNFIGFLVGDPGLRDVAEEMRRRAERVVETFGIDVAIERGLVNKDGVPLDTRPRVFGRPNPNYNKPLDEKVHIRSHRLYLLVREAGKEKFELAHLQTNDNRLALAWCSLPFYTWVTFPALIQAHDASGYHLTGSTGQSTLTVFKQVKCPLDIYTVYKDYFEKRSIPIGQVEKYHEATKDAWDRWVSVYGVVAYLNVERETLFGIPGLLIDPDVGYEEEHQVPFYLPEHIGINFDVPSEVWLFGRTRRRKARDPETGELVDRNVVIDVYGVYPNPEYAVKAEEAVGEEELKGFIKLEE